jgi:hypothetical protein
MLSFIYCCLDAVTWILISSADCATLKIWIKLLNNLINSYTLLWNKILNGTVQTIWWCLFLCETRTWLPDQDLSLYPLSPLKTTKEHSHWLRHPKPLKLEEYYNPTWSDKSRLLAKRRCYTCRGLRTEYCNVWIRIIFT